ncbi:Protein CBFA2T3 [Chelonia mydas]|uniref:Protein CBFA2T3 n=1 Tax=Chelonia mydas TaxID=8469 RepID=M7BW18_CHEMY|nr:Protein CBFA2T3 [Chelonia mydas]
MPDSPADVKTQSRSTPPNMPPPPPAVTQGATRHPSFTPNTTCGARQLSKLKRFLTTLQQFGNDISPEIGERVRTLVLGLVNSTLTIEEFHSKLQEATNFPLRPFVIPFLKANLPLLQRELLHCARMAKQTPAQYLAQHEQLLLDANASSPIDSSELLLEVTETGKRRTPDSRASTSTLRCTALLTRLRGLSCVHTAQRWGLAPSHNGTRDVTLPAAGSEAPGPECL